MGKFDFSKIQKIIDNPSIDLVQVGRAILQELKECDIGVLDYLHVTFWCAIEQVFEYKKDYEMARKNLIYMAVAKGGAPADMNLCMLFHINSFFCVCNFLFDT